MRWGMSRAELEKRILRLYGYGHSEDWQDARHRDGIGAAGSDGLISPPTSRPAGRKHQATLDRPASSIS
jgi:hypothetical protein